MTTLSEDRRTAGDWRVDRLQRIWADISAWTDQHRPWTDVGLVVFILAISLLPPKQHAALLNVRDVSFEVALVVPLIWRRRAPTAAFAAITIVAFAQWLWAVPLPADCALLVALFSLTLRSPPRRALLGAGALLGGVVLASLRWRLAGDIPRSIVFLGGMEVAALSAAVATLTWRSYTDAQAERTRRLEFERDQQAQLATAAERSRIAREMHDVVAHNVSIMVALADGALAKADTHLETAKEAMADVSATGRHALGDMRQILGLLGAPEVVAEREPQPQLSGLHQLIDRVRGTGLSIDFGQFGRPFDPPPSVQLTIYRIVQESLTNVMKHAEGPTTATVNLTFDAPVVDVLVRDDGTHTPLRGDGRGVDGMRERAAFCGGTLTAGPKRDRGWEVSARLRADL